MKQFYIKNRKGYLKLLKAILLVLIIAFSPIIIAISWQWIWGIFGETINEGNSAVFSIGWLTMITLPVGAIIILLLLIVLIWDSIAIKINQKGQ
jgi:TRAP-type C4-dicarboxylate transport system permease small subunit